MHPDLLRALEKERRAELLRHQHFRPSRTELPATRRPRPRVRRSLGLALVGIGTRLLRDGGSAIDLVDVRR
jgi:hypothetical protein